MRKKFKPLTSADAVKPDNDIWHHVLAVSLFSFILFCLLATENNFGKVADHFILIVFLTATRLYLMKNGLFSIPYYTPLMGAGLPLYADPQTGTYSLTQFVFNIYPDAYVAIKFAFIASTLLAYIACYQLIRHFKIKNWIAAAGSVIFALNGFITSRWIMGWYSNYWEIPWILLCIIKIYQSDNIKTVIKNSAWLSILLSMLIYDADINSIYLAMVSAFTLLVAWIVCFGKPVFCRWKYLVASFIIPVAAMQALSKGLAIMDYLRQFPRVKENNLMDPLHILWLIPNALFNPTLDISTKIPFNLGGWHEYCNYSGITLLPCLVMATIHWYQSRKDSTTGKIDRSKLFFIFWPAFTILFVGYMMLGKNVLWIILKKLPIIKSYHMISRWMGIIPITLVLFATNYLSDIWGRNKRFVPFLFCVFFVLDVTIYFANNDYSLHGPYSTVTYPDQTKDFKVERWYHGVGVQYLDKRVGDSYPTPPQFGYVGDNSARKMIVDPQFPPTHQFADGTYNVSDPAAMIYPEEVGRPHWSRLPVEGNQEKVEKFLSFEDPGFYVPKRQKIANYISVFGYLFSLFVLLFIYSEKISSWFIKPLEHP